VILSMQAQGGLVRISGLSHIFYHPEELFLEFGGWLYPTDVHIPILDLSRDNSGDA